MTDTRALEPSPSDFPPLLEAPESESPPGQHATGRSIRDHRHPAVCFRHSGWTMDRARIGDAFDRTRQTNNRCFGFAACGSDAYVLQSCDDPNTYRIAGSCCRDRFCLPCATERSCVIAGNVQELIHDKEVRFLTLTINTAELGLAQALDKLYIAFQALRRRVLWTKAVDGGVAFTELKWSQTKERWHPHLHCLIEGRYLPQRKIAEAWREITTDSYIVDIRRPMNADAVARYVTKYASKPFNSSYLRFPDRLDTAILALKGRKLAITFGTWRGLTLTAVPVEGAWQHVASLETVLYRAKNGDSDCVAILASITDRDLSSILELCPARPPPQDPPPAPDVQTDWLGAWRKDGTFQYRYDPGSR